MQTLRRAIVVAVVLGAFAPTTAAAFTLIQPVIKLYVNPHVGYTTSLVQVRGTLSIQGTCSTTVETFQFLFDAKALWTKKVNGCNPATGLWDTTWSAYLVPPVQRTPGKHTIQMKLATLSTSFTYTIVAAPASPSPSTAPPSPSASPSASPPCTAGMLPAPGSGGFFDNLVAASMVAATLPLVALAVFGPSQFLAVVGRRRRTILQLLGITLLLMATLGCTSTAAAPGNSPVAAVSPSTAPSPSPSPSPSC